MRTRVHQEFGNSNRTLTRFTGFYLFQALLGVAQLFVEFVQLKNERGWDRMSREAFFKRADLFFKGFNFGGDLRMYGLRVGHYFGIVSLGCVWAILASYLCNLGSIASRLAVKAFHDLLLQASELHGPLTNLGVHKRYSSIGEVIGTKGILLGYLACITIQIISKFPVPNLPFVDRLPRRW